MHRSLLLPLFLLPLLAGAAPPRSSPTALSMPRAEAPPLDVPWPGGTMRLEIDATNVTQRIVTVTQTIPLAGGGPLTLLLPQWIPGKHAPRGFADKVAGLAFTVDGKPLAWERNPLDVHAFRLVLPPDARTLVARFQFLGATISDQGRVSITDRMMNLQFEALSLYPAGYYTRRIPVAATIAYPAGWQAATALRGRRSGDTVAYEPVDYETLIDSPVFAGRFMKSLDLGQNVTLNMMGDTPEEIAPTPAQIAIHRKLVAEAVALFGARHFDHYDFLFAISDDLDGIGVEHQRSSENGVDLGYFTRWAEGPGSRNILAHEFTHSWNGKYRRPEGLWTPDYRTPMQDQLLWVYEGQTQFWGYVLGARSGLYSKDQTLDALAAIAARLDTTRGRTWRPLADTTNDPVIAARRPKAWTSWQRSEDYYNEGLMIWLEADAILRRQTKGARGMDDFARAFFGMRDGDWGTLTYTRADVVQALGALAPYDWAGFLARRVDETSQEVTKGGFDLAGYRLVYDEKPNSTVKQAEANFKWTDQSFGIGLTVRNDGGIAGVAWDSPAFKAGLSIGDRIVAIDGTEFSAEGFRQALGTAKGANAQISVLVKQGKRYRTIPLAYSGGLRYPHLEKIGEGETSLDRLLKSRTGGA